MLARRSLLIVLANLLGALGGLAVLFVVGHYMGPAPFGMIGFSLSIVGLAGVVARLGFDAAHRKRVSEGVDLATCLGTYVRIKFALVAVYALVLVGAATAWHRWQGFHDATTYPILLLTIAYAVLLELRQIPISTFDALLRTARAQAAILAEQVVRVPLVVVAALAYGAVTRPWVPLRRLFLGVADRLGLQPPLDAATGGLLLAGAFLIGMGASAAFAWWMLRRTPRPWRYDGTLARSYARFALPMTMLTVAATMLMETDRFMIGYFWGAADVGHYFAAQRILQVVLLVPTAIATLFFPIISELAARRETEGVRAVVATTQRALSLIMAFLVACVAVFAPEGIRILQTGSFDPAAAMLSVLSLYALTMAFFTVAQNIVVGFDRPRLAARVGVLMLAVNFALNLVLIPDSLLGVPLAGAKGLGAAVSTVAAQAVGTIVLVIASRRLTGAWPIGRATAKHVAAGAATAALLWWSKAWAFGGVDRFHELAAMGVAGLAVYVGILAVWREVTRRDWLLVRDLLHPRRLAHAIREDFTERDER